MPGHGMADCPILKDDMEQSTNICFKCGSSEHLARVCSAKVPKGIFSVICLLFFYSVKRSHSRKSFIKKHFGQL